MPPPFQPCSAEWIVLIFPLPSSADKIKSRIQNTMYPHRTMCPGACGQEQGPQLQTPVQASLHPIQHIARSVLGFWCPLEVTIITISLGFVYRRCTIMTDVKISSSKTFKEKKEMQPQRADSFLPSKTCRQAIPSPLLFRNKSKLLMSRWQDHCSKEEKKMVFL